MQQETVRWFTMQSQEKQRGLQWDLQRIYAGRIVAQNIMGKGLEYRGVLGTAVCKLPGLNVGRTGLTEAQAKEEGFEPVSVVTVVDDKAHYYAGASIFIIKMIADKETLRLLGVQVIGSVR